jgi:transposase
MELTDEQWSAIAPQLPGGKSGPGKRGRPRQDDRAILEGILWILRTGARWQDLPKEFPPYQTCHRRHGEWAEADVLDKILAALLKDLVDRGKIDLSECFIDATFVSAKKGVLELVRQSTVRGPRSWQLRTAMVFLSQRGLRVLHRTRSDLLKKPSITVSPRPRRKD